MALLRRHRRPDGEHALSWSAPGDREGSRLSVSWLRPPCPDRLLGRVDGAVAELAAEGLVGVELAMVEPLVAGAVAREDRLLGGIGEELAGQLGGERGLGPWGARSRVSCCVLVLVDQATEDVAAT